MILIDIDIMEKETILKLDQNIELKFQLSFVNQVHFQVRLYRVFIKEGQKVKAYQTAKICLFRPSIEFILTTTYEHLFIYTKDFKYFT